MLVTRPKSGIIKSTNAGSIKIIQQDRVDDLFDGYAFDILGGKEGEGNAGDSRGNRMCDVHVGGVERNSERKCTEKVEQM